MYQDCHLIQPHAVNVLTQQIWPWKKSTGPVALFALVDAKTWGANQPTDQVGAEREQRSGK